MALVAVGVWNFLVGVPVVGWGCIGMAVLLAYHIAEKYWAGD